MLDILKRIPQNVWYISIVGFFVQLGGTLVYANGFESTKEFMSPTDLLFNRAISESASTLVKPISGVLSDYFSNRKVFLLIGYGFIVFTKFFFWVSTLTWLLPLSLLYWLYISNNFVDRICDALRDAPRNALVLDSIHKECDKKEVSHIKSLSFSLRKGLSAIGTILACILSFFLLKYKLLTISSLCIVAVIMILIATLIIQYMIYDVPHNEIVENNYIQFNIWPCACFSILVIFSTIFVNNLVLIPIGIISCLGLMKTECWKDFLKYSLLFIGCSFSIFFRHKFFILINSINLLQDLIFLIIYIWSHWELIEENKWNLLITIIISGLFFIPLQGNMTWILSILSMLILQSIYVFQQTKIYKDLLCIPEKNEYYSLILFGVLLAVCKLNNSFLFVNFIKVGFAANYVSLLQLFLYISICFSSFFITPFVARLSRKYVLLIMVIFLFITNCFMYDISSKLSLIITSFVFGLNNSLFENLLPHLISRTIPSFHLRGTMFGIFDICLALSSTFGALMTQYFYTKFSMKIAISIIFIPITVAFIFSLYLFIFYKKDNIE